MKVLITQSNYIPWKGYFDSINQVDIVILYDDVQYTKRDWRNRNKIKTPEGSKWLTIPVSVSGKFSQAINETEIHDPSWGVSHWQAIIQNYRHAPNFTEFAGTFESLYLNTEETLLSRVNYVFIKTICDLLNIKTAIRFSTDFQKSGSKSERLLDICQQLNATAYFSGPAAKAYLDESLFTNAGISIRWLDYSGYPEYPQLHGNFEHEVSILDLLFNTGNKATKFMKSFN